jgi:NAD(P)-dependent dehydrogenase (short-subunit alcohol dehydrogenase family)
MSTSADDALNGRTVIVLGAAGGVGAGITRELAARGARVVAAGRTRKNLDELAEATPGQVLVEVIDVEHDPPRATAARLVERYGPAAGAVISIGTRGTRQQHQHVLDIEDDELLEMVHGNELNGLRALRTIVPAVAPDGAVVNLLGYSAEIPFPMNPLVGSTNAAVRSLLASLAAQEPGPRIHGLVIGMVRTAARQAAGVDDERWLTGEQVGARAAELIGTPSTETFPHLLDVQSLAHDDSGIRAAGG